MNLLCNNILTSPTSYGISCAIIATTVLMAASSFLVENIAPIAIPSRILWIKSPIKFKYPSICLFLKD